MNPSGKKRFNKAPAFGEPPTEKVKTLADEQMKKLLDNQLDTETTLTKELERKQNLTQPILVQDETTATTGFKSLDEFKTIMEGERNITMLREHGLTNDEILIKLNVEKHGDSYAADQLKCSNTLTEKLKIIDEKIKKHQEELEKPDHFSATIDVNRRELETNNASELQPDGGGKFSYLVKLKEKEYLPNDPVCATLREYEESVKKKENDKDDGGDDGGDGKPIGPVICSINERVQKIPEEIITQNRLSLSEIRELERFKEYKTGEANRVLYIKNLKHKVSEKDLARLFGRYYVKGHSDVEYKVMKGRMRGQAFVTFTDERTATEALLFLNGYKFNGQPIIISYGKGKT